MQAKLGELARVLAPRRQAGALLALPVPVVPVGVLRGQFMAPFAMRLTPVGSDERSAARPVLQSADGFPVGRILACAVRAVIPPTAVRAAVVADVIDGLARLKRVHELGETVSVRVARASSPCIKPVIELPVPVLSEGGGPGPALVGGPPVDVREVSVETSHVETAQRTASHTGSAQLDVMGLAEFSGELRPTALAANSRHIASLVHFHA